MAEELRSHRLQFSIFDLHIHAWAHKSRASSRQSAARLIDINLLVSKYSSFPNAQVPVRIRMLYPPRVLLLLRLQIDPDNSARSVCCRSAL